MEPPIWAWIALILAVPVLASIDLLVFGRGGKAVSVRTAALWSACWIALGLSFALAACSASSDEAPPSALDDLLSHMSSLSLVPRRVRPNATSM